MQNGHSKSFKVNCIDVNEKPLGDYIIIIIIIMGFISAIYESSRSADKTSDDMLYGIVQF